MAGTSTGIEGSAASDSALMALSSWFTLLCCWAWAASCAGDRLGPSLLLLSEGACSEGGSICVIGGKAAISAALLTCTCLPAGEKVTPPGCMPCE